MAKGNMFLGMSRGSVGDVTFYRSNRQQIARARNRNPRNPKSNRQLYQRAVFATVIRAYQAGKAIFDHAFQGLSVGAENQREFMSLNLRMLRSLVSADLAEPRSSGDALSRVVAPGIMYPVANPYIISRGSYSQQFFEWNESVGGFNVPAASTIGEGETVSNYAIRLGLIPGDIYTLVFFAEGQQEVYQTPNTSSLYAAQMACDFGWVRMIVNDTVLGSSAIMEQLSNVFHIESGGSNFSFRNIAEIVGAVDTGDVLSFETLVSGLPGMMSVGSMGMIRSRLDQDLRSDTVMHCVYGGDQTAFGLTPEYIIPAWSAATELGNSDLILEGGEV